LKIKKKNRDYIANIGPLKRMKICKIVNNGWDILDAAEAMTLSVQIIKKVLQCAPSRRKNRDSNQKKNPQAIKIFNDTNTYLKDIEPNDASFNPESNAEDFSNQLCIEIAKKHEKGLALDFICKEYDIPLSCAHLLIERARILKFNGFFGFKLRIA
jgi:hypothetical protein